LPLHLTEYMRERQRNHADPTSKRFLDVFHHRLLSLFYRAWAEARPTVSHDRPGDDYWAARLAALSGRGQPELQGQGP
ncbi:type VI secretion system baseplate subunit TssG, partial [Pseudomonas soli]